MDYINNSKKLEQIILDPNVNKHRLTITPNEYRFDEPNIICSNALDILAIFVNSFRSYIIIIINVHIMIFKYFYN
jgi:hypothetical protein